MNFFKEIASMAPGVAITMNIMETNGSMTVSIVPNAIKNVRPLIATGTPEELDEAFLDQIRQSMEVTAGVVANAEQYQESVKGASSSTSAKATADKTGKGKKPTASSTAKTTADEDEEESDEEVDEELSKEPAKKSSTAKAKADKGEPTKEKAPKVANPLPAEPEKKGPQQLSLI